MSAAALATSGAAAGGESGVDWLRAGGQWPLLVICLLLPACATRVPAGDSLASGVGSSAVLRIEDERGPLRAAPAAAALRRLEAEEGRAADEGALLARHLAQVEGVMNAPISVGNDAHLLIDGPQTQQAMLQAIAQARHHIDLETYILEPNGIGERLAALLESKRSQGARVRVLYDSVGSLATPKTYFDRLTWAGIAVCEFNPLNPLRMAEDSKLGINNRDHRKVLIVDQQVAFTGGINISAVYSSASFGRRRNVLPSLVTGWRDTHVAVRGPVVDQFQKLFDATWTSQRCEDQAEVRGPAASCRQTRRADSHAPGRRRPGE